MKPVALLTISTLLALGCSSLHAGRENSLSDAPAPDSPDPREAENAGRAWIVDAEGGVCVWTTALEEASDATVWLGAQGALYRIVRNDPGHPYQLAMLEPHPVYGLLRQGPDMIVAFGSLGVVRFDDAGVEHRYGADTSTPIAVADTCVGMARVKPDGLEQDLVVSRSTASELHVVPLPPQPSGFRRSITSIMGLNNALIVTQNQSDVFRVDCATLDVSRVSSDGEGAHLGGFGHDARGRFWGVDYRKHTLVRSEDEGQTWQDVQVPQGWTSTAVAVHGSWVAVASEKATTMLLSSDSGESWTLETLDTWRKPELETQSLHVSSRGVVTVGARCNFVAHRRAPLGK